MPPVTYAVYTFTNSFNNTYSVSFMPMQNDSFIPQFWGGNMQPQFNVPYTYMDTAQLYVVVFGNNLQLVGNPVPSGDGNPGDSVFNLQVVQFPNASGYEAYQFPIAGLNKNQIYLSLQTESGKIKTKPLIHSPVSTPSILQGWPYFKNIVAEEVSLALENAFQRIEKLLEK